MAWFTRSLCIPHPCTQCGVHVDSSGIHGLSCRKSDGRHPHHAALNDIVKRALAAADIPSMLEPVGLCRSDGKRADGVTVISCREANPLPEMSRAGTLSLLHTFHLLPLERPRMLTRQKAEKHSLPGNYPISLFVPIGFESLGIFGDCTMSFLKELAHHIQLKTADPQSFHHLCQTISVTIYSKI